MDRAALDFAIERGYAHGGYCPAGRRAEDGPISVRYELTELASEDYRKRTRKNVEESDGTLILTPGAPSGGALATLRFAELFKKPCCIVFVPVDVASVDRIVNWLHSKRIKRLNVAGPRESKHPGIYAITKHALGEIESAFSTESSS